MQIKRCCRVYLLFFCLLVNLGSIASAQDQSIWTNLGIFGGHVQDVAVDPADPDRIFAATYGGRGLFLSVDGGVSWLALEMDNSIEGEDTFNEQAVYAVAIAPSNPDIIWVGHNYWLAKSTDGGLTWTHIRNSSIQRDCPTCGGAYDNWRLCLSIAIHPGNPDVVYVGTGGAWSSDAGGAVYATQDGGTTWNKLNGGANLDYRVEDLAIRPDAPATVWAVTNANGYQGIWDGTVYHSDDDGQTFAPSNPDTVYAAWMRANDSFWQGDGLPKISRGLFDGSSWTWETFIPDPQNALSFDCLAVHPMDPDIVLGGDQSLGMLISQDHGAHWTPINKGLDAVIVYDVDTDDNQPDHMLAASNSGLYERENRNSAWIRRHNGQFRSVEFYPSSSSAYFGGGVGFVARSPDNGVTWNYSNALGNVYVEDIAVDPSDTSRVYIATGHYGRQIQRSGDGGEHFQPVLDGINQAGQAYGMNAVVVDPHDPRHVLACGGNFYSPKVLGDLWQSSNGGDTWRRTGLTDTVVNSALIDPVDPRVIYAGCGHSVNSSPPLLKSSDGGTTWVPQTDGLPNRRIFISNLWSPSATFMMGVGWYGTILYFDGRSTAIMDSGTSLDLSGIHGVSPADVWVVGQEGTILHYDGSLWSMLASPIDTDLNGVWAAASDQVIVVGDNGVILSFDGTAWRPMDSGTTQALNGVFAFSGNDAYAVGDNGTIVHYDGTGWTAMQSNTSRTLLSVWGADPANLFAVGSEETALHFDGSVWTVIHSGSTDNPFANVWGTAAEDVYVTAGANGRLLHYDGTDWVDSFIPDARDTWALGGADPIAFSSETITVASIFSTEPAGPPCGHPAAFIVR